MSKFYGFIGQVVFGFAILVVLYLVIRPIVALVQGKLAK